MQSNSTSLCIHQATTKVLLDKSSPIRSTPKIRQQASFKKKRPGIKYFYGLWCRATSTPECTEGGVQIKEAPRCRRPAPGATYRSAPLDGPRPPQSPGFPSIRMAVTLLNIPFVGTSPLMLLNDKSSSSRYWRLLREIGIDPVRLL